MPSPRGTTVAASFRTSRIIHAAMLASLVVYAGLVQRREVVWEAQRRSG